MSAATLDQRDWPTFAATLAVASGILGIGLAMTYAKAFNRTVSRKVMHIGTGSAFLAMWPLFSDAPGAKWLCASVIVIATLVFVLVGSGTMRNSLGDLLVNSATRHGARVELLLGPLMYGMVHTIITVALWRQSPAAAVAISMLCFGDGFAELVGRQWGRRRLWHNSSKTVEGTASCFIAAALSSCFFLHYFNSRGYYDPPLDPSTLAPGCALIALLVSLVESLPLAEIDNLTIPAVAISASWWYWGR